MPDLTTLKGCIEWAEQLEATYKNAGIDAEALRQIAATLRRVEEDTERYDAIRGLFSDRSDWPNVEVDVWAGNLVSITGCHSEEGFTSFDEAIDDARKEAEDAD